MVLIYNVWRSVLRLSYKQFSGLNVQLLFGSAHFLLKATPTSSMCTDIDHLVGWADTDSGVIAYPTS